MMTAGKASRRILSRPDTTGLAVFSPLSLDVGPIAFNYTAASGGSLIIGGTLSGAGVLTAGPDDFGIKIDNFTTSPFVSVFVYTEQGTAGTYIASTTSVQVQTLAATPIPPTLPLLASGLLALTGFAFVKNRRKPALPSSGAV